MTSLENHFLKKKSTDLLQDVKSSLNIEQDTYEYYHVDICSGFLRHQGNSPGHDIPHLCPTNGLFNIDSGIKHC